MTNREYIKKQITNGLPNNYLRQSQRFVIMQNRKQKYDFIVNHLRQGHRVIISTAYKATEYTAKHIDYFTLCSNGVFVKHGKSDLCIDHTTIKAYN